MGFDRNFAKLLGIARGKFILFSTDDDMFIKGSLDKVIDHLNVSDAAISFTPYMDKKTGIVERKFPKSFILNKGIKSVKNYLYCSILLSGLIFQNDKIVNYSSERFKDLIYSQVYLFATLLLKNDGLYIDIPLVHCVGDGENAFGLNESSEKNVLLSDRKSSLSNLEYHKALIEVIKIFDSENATDLLNSFSKEYSLRSFTGMYIARKNSRDELKAYWIMMKSLNIKTYATSHIYYWLLSILGCKVCDLIFYVPKAGLLKARQLKSRL